MKKNALLAALAVLVSALLAGCGGTKYKVDYCGSKDFFKGAKDSYRAGAQVTLTFDMIATDTDYTFYVDGENFSADYENGCYVLRFTMPDHDITVDYDAVNSSVYVPESYEGPDIDAGEDNPEVTNAELLPESCMIYAADITTVGTEVQRGLYADDLFDLLHYLGMLPADINGLPEDCVHVSGGTYEIPVDARIAGERVYGKLTCDAGLPEEQRVIAEMDLYSKMSYSALAEVLTVRCGEAVDSGLEPYAEVNGGEVTWDVFDDGCYTYKISQGSNNDRLMLTIRLKG